MITYKKPAVNQSVSYSIAEAAQILGIHRNTMGRYVARGLVKTGISRIDSRKHIITGKNLMRFWEAAMKPL